MDVRAIADLESRRVDKERTIDGYQPDTGVSAPAGSTGQQPHIQEIKALWVDLAAWHTKLRDGLQHVHMWMQSIDTQMQDINTWMQGMDA